MTITVNNVRETKTRKVVCFTLIDNTAQEYKATCGVSLDTSDEQAYCEANIERLLMNLRYKEYRKAPASMDLTEFETWIAQGHKIQTGTDENDKPIYKVIEKKDFKGTHPRFVHPLKAKTANAKSVPALKAIVLEILDEIK